MTGWMFAAVEAVALTSVIPPQTNKAGIALSAGERSSVSSRMDRADYMQADGRRFAPSVCPAIRGILVLPGVL